MESPATPRQRFFVEAADSSTKATSSAKYAAPMGTSQSIRTIVLSPPLTPARFGIPILRPAVITPSQAPSNIASNAVMSSVTGGSGWPTPALSSGHEAAMAPSSNPFTSSLAPEDPFYAVWAVKDPGTIAPPTANDLRKRTVHQLRKQCAEYGVTIKRTGPDRKKMPEGEAQAIAQDKYLRAKRTVVSGVDTESAQPTASSRNCPIRLMNVIFSDKFAARLTATGARATREELDTGTINNQSSFWTAVTVDFNTNTTDYNDIILPEHTMFRSIDPSAIVQCDTDQLVAIWKRVVGKYKKADGNFTRSGTHESEFFQGAIDVAYTRAWLNVKPNMIGFINGGLRPEMQRDSIRRQESTNGGKNKRKGAPSSQKPQPKKWQEEVASSVSRMAEFIIQQQQQQLPPPNSTSTAASTADAVLERLTRYHKLIHVATTRLRKLQAEGEAEADESLERSLAKYKARVEALEAELDEI